MASATTPYTSEQIGMFIITAVLCALATSSYFLRCMSRRSRKGSWVLNDYITAVAFVLMIGYVVITVLLVVYGVGKHITAVMATDPSALTTMSKTVIPGGLLWGYSTCLAKLSIVTLYLELFPSRTMKRVCWTVFTVIVAFMIAYTLSVVLMCRPLSVLWDSSQTGSCDNIYASEISAAAINVALDIAIILIPQPVVWKLQMPWSRKVTISLVFSVGVMTIIVTVLRLYYVVALTQSPNPEDVTWLDFPINLCAVLESTLGVICACLPTLRPVFVNVHESVRRMLSGTNTSAISLRRYFKGSSASAGAVNDRNRSDDGASSGKDVGRVSGKEGVSEDSLELRYQR